MATEKKAGEPNAALAPQPGAANPKQADSGDAALMFFLGLGKFFRGIFRMNLMAYFFWTGLLYVIGATLLLIGFNDLSPSISRVPACPAKQSGYLLVALWYLLAVINIGTSYGYSAILTMGFEEFQHLTGYMQAIGFMTKVVPTYSRLVHVFNLCQLDIMAVQLLFLPECNSSGIVIVFGFVLLIWWAVIVFGVWAKRRIFVPPFLYQPLRPGRAFTRELEKLMRSFGP